MTIIILWFILFSLLLITIWSINILFCADKAHQVCNSNFELGRYDLVDIVYKYHSPVRLDAWFGFRHWFYPWKL